MKVLLIRNTKDDLHTGGHLFIVSNNVVIRHWKTIEPPFNNNKRFTAIPEGIFPMEYEYSAKFKMKLWELKGIPHRSEIKIHQGNTRMDTTGCILIGETKANKSARLYNSTETLKEFHSIMVDHLKYTIQIINLF